MIFIANILLGLTLVITAILGLIIYISGSRKEVNLYLSLFLGSASIWLVANILANVTQEPSVSLIYARLTLIGAALMPYFYLLFALSFTGYRINKKISIQLLVLPLILLILTPTSFNIESVEEYGRNTVPGIGYTLLVFYYMTYFGVVIYVMRKFRKKLNVTSTQKAQIQWILTGLLSTLIPSLITTAILPFIGYLNAVYFGPVSVVTMVVFTSIAIVKHKLFDIKLVIIRAATYTLTIGFLIAFYIIVGVGAVNLIVKEQGSAANDILLFGIAVLMAMIVGPLRQFFDKLTNRIFFREQYDPQTLLDVFNRTLVEITNVNDLLLRSSLILKEYLKITHATFYLRETAYFKPRIFGTEKNTKLKDIEKIDNITKKMKEKLCLITNETYNKDSRILAQLIKANNSDAIFRLVGTTEYSITGTGYIFVGPKKSGASLTEQDTRLLGIIGNELVVAIENSLKLEEIESFNLTLQSKIDNATKELQQSNEKLTALDEAKDEFVSMASHQLRTPLTSIKGYISMVLEGDAGEINQIQQSMLKQAFFSSQRMVYLISDLLDVSRLKTGKFLIEARPVYLPDVITSELEQLKEEALAKKIKIKFKKPDKLAYLQLDENKIRQVIMNFTDNAIYYTPTGGKIEVSLKEKDDNVIFTVTDSGIGVPENEQHKLFAKFYRAENARKMRPDGTGLGLFMAKKVIDAQGGSIVFESKEGKGSSFGFEFPINKLKVKK